MTVKRNITVWLPALLWVSAAAGSPGAAPPPQNISAAPVPCHLRAYVIDPDPQGLNVRRGPGKTYDVIARLKASDQVIVLITGGSGNWMKVEGANAVGDTPVYEGAGWAYGPMLGLTTRYNGKGPRREVLVFKEPRAGSEVVGRIAEEVEVAVTGCKDDWVKIRYRSVEGWLDRGSQCGNPVTTCP